MTLGQRISHYRKKLHISQEELGARLGISRQAVSKWETDLSVPDMNNLLALAREFGISVAELTETPEEPSPPKSAGKKWQLGLAVCILLPVLAIGLLILYQVNRSSVGQVGDLPLPLSDFYLEWQVPRKDGREQYEFLTLGNQTEAFPFHTSLRLTAPEDVVTENTDLHLAAVHHAVCGELYVDYIHYQADPELGQTEGDTVCRISTMTPGYRTPRGISVGDGKLFVLDAYGISKEGQAGGTLLYGLKEESGDSPVSHDYRYIWSAFEDGCGYQTIYFYMKDGLVAGISMELMQDMGDYYAAANNTSTFPVDENGDPDYSGRQDIYQEPVDAARQAYIAWNQLVTNENLSAEERYAYRRDVFTNLPDMDWQEFGALGSTDEDSTKFAFMDWLAEQDSYSASEILRIQWGCTASGLDGAYADSYDKVLCSALFSDPVTYAKILADPDTMSNETKWYAILGAAFYAELFPEQEQAAVNTLDAAINANTLTLEETGWAKLLRYYLANPNDGFYGDYPKTPAELESLQNG